MTTYSGTLLSEFIISSDNLAVAIDGGPPPQAEGYNLSDLLLKHDNLAVAIGVPLPQLPEVINSVLKISSDNLELVVKGTSLVPPINTRLRQIYSDDTHVYGATNKGLVVFKL